MSSRKWSISELAAAMVPPRHRDTLVKVRRFGTTKPSTARELELLTGVDRRRFLWPDEYGNPWPEILREEARDSI